ncbi:MAG: transposase [Veillonellaceae bacterium]|nr:transposase [Veillonellaceae bacterium]
MQVDFGEISVPTTGGRKKKLYCMATVLAHSRYKYAAWSDQPFTTARLTALLNQAFEYIGGMPQELVFDQDKLVAVSENHGDIVFTEEFERFKQALHLKIYLCRKSDPESKGKIEAVVKYVKNNFAKHRLFTGIRDWNQAQIDWLERTGNQKEHGTTKKVPAKVHALEKQHLQPIPSIKLPEDILSAIVRKDNTILYKGNRYSLPLGTYEPSKTVKITIQENKLEIFDNQTDTLLAEHTITSGRGLLIKNNNHRRDNTVVINQLQSKTLETLSNTANAKQFLAAIRKAKSRYARDQFQILTTVAKHYSPEIVEKAIVECLRLKFISAVACRDMAEYIALSSKSCQSQTQPEEGSLPNGNVPVIQAEHRNVTAYTSLYGGMH